MSFVMEGLIAESNTVVKQAHAGSSTNLSKMLATYHQYLLLIANREIESELQAKVGPSDLVQDTLFEAQRDVDRFNGTNEADIRAWLRKILINNIANIRIHYRSTLKRELGREVPLQSVEVQPKQKNLLTKEPSPSECYAAGEQKSAIDEAMMQLTEQQREALRLRHQENCSFEEMGQRLSRSPEAARKLWARAVEQLKHLMKLSHDRH